MLPAVLQGHQLPWLARRWLPVREQRGACGRQRWLIRHCLNHGGGVPCGAWVPQGSRQGEERCH